MGQQWYYEQDGEQHGPVTGAELKQLAAAGKLNAADKVKKDGMADWLPAAQVKGLLPDMHEKVRQKADAVGKAAGTVSKVAKAASKVSDAVSDVAEAGGKVQKAVTTVAGIAAGGSTVAGSIGDFLRPLGPINLVIFAVTLVGGAVLFGLAQRKPKVRGKVRLNLGAVASLVVATIFGLWTGLGAVAGKRDKGFLATNVKPIEQLQASVVPAREQRQEPPKVELPPGEVRRFPDQAQPVCCVAFGANGTLGLAGSGDIGMADQRGRLSAWDAASGNEVGLFKDVKSGVRSLAVSADGRRLVTAGADRTLRLWDADAGVDMLQFNGHQGKLQAVAFDKDGQQLLSGGQEDKTVRLWDATTGKPIHTFQGHDAGVLSVACSPDGHYALSGSFDKTARLWDLAEKRQAAMFSGFGGGVEAVAFSPDGRYAVCGSNRYKGGEPVPTLRLWETATWKEVHNFQGHTEPVLSVTFSPDGRRLLTGGVGGVLRLWDTDSGRQVYYAQVCPGRLNSVAFSPDGTLALLGCGDKTVRLWRLPTTAQEQN